LKGIWWISGLITAPLRHLEETKSAYRVLMKWSVMPVFAAIMALIASVLIKVPATWGVVAALLDEESAKFRPGSEACWYGPDIIDRVVHAKVAHEIGSHGGKHVQFDSVSAAEAPEDLDFAREVHRANTLPFKSFIFPRDAVGHLDVLTHAGLRTFRGRDIGWFETARRAGRTRRQLC
jgi:hypothetical protein